MSGSFNRTGIVGDHNRDRAGFDGAGLFAQVVFDLFPFSNILDVRDKILQFAGLVVNWRERNKHPDQVTILETKPASKSLAPGYCIRIWISV